MADLRERPENWERPFRRIRSASGIRRAPFVPTVGFEGIVDEERLRIAVGAFHKTHFADAAISHPLAEAYSALTGGATLTWAMKEIHRRERRATVHVRAEFGGRDALPHLQPNSHQDA